MARIVWTEHALNDLERIGDYLAEKAPGYAEVTIRRIFSSVERLERFPESGRFVPELEPTGFREVIHKGYRVLYLFDAEEETVEILSVLHSSQQFGEPPGQNGD